MANSLEDPRQYLDVLAGLHDDLLERDLQDISLRIPKRPLVLFFGRSTFSDNTKYAYLHALRNLPDLEVVWCAGNSDLARQLAAHHLPVLDLTADPKASVRELLRCAVAVFCENPQSTFAFHPALAGALAGAQVIQLWHGISIKHLDLMLLPHLDVLHALTRRSLRLATRPDYFLSTAPIFDAFWAQAHGASRVFRAGHPRNEVLFRDADGLEMIGADLPESLARKLREGGSRQILIAPTWTRGTPLFTSTTDFFERIEIWARTNRVTAVVKPHPFLREGGLPSRPFESIVFLDAGVDIYPWLSRFDALVTDYSSIMFDFSLTGNPVFALDVALHAPHAFEPDWSLVPSTHFHYAFDALSLERVLDENWMNHPLRDAQREFTAHSFATDPRDANQAVCRLIAACYVAHVDRPLEVVEFDGT